MAIERESDVRDIVRRLDKPFWIEPTRGSTVGLPDCFIMGKQRKPVFLELKVGLFVKGELRFTVRPAQRMVIREMVGEGYDVRFLIGIIGTESSLVVAHSTVDALNGRMAAGYRLVVDGSWSKEQVERVWKDAFRAS